MEKIAIIELGMDQIRLSIIRIEPEVHFETEEEYGEFVGIGRHIEGSGLIKTAKIKECIAVLQMYKQIATAAGVSKFHCVASANLSKAKNYTSFIDEAGLALDLTFNMLSDEHEIEALYIAIVNTLDVPKGLIVSISTAATRIIHYCRRVVLNSVVIPVGVTNFTTAEAFTKELSAVGESIEFIDSEVPIIGTGDIFTGASRLSRKIKRYPVDIDNNYIMNKDGFDEVYNFLNGLDVEKSAKLKGIPASGVGQLISGMEIVLAIMDYTGLTNIIVNRNNRTTGLAYSVTMPDIKEKPVYDVFTASAESIIWACGLDRQRAFAHYNLANVLYTQLRVLHKLPRTYGKILKAATLLYTLGSKVNKQNYERINYFAVLNSNLCGLSHKEIVLSAFIAGCKHWDDFSLSEWVKYKDIMTDEDLDAVRKLAIIAAMAEVMNMRMSGTVKDISCDILGDSVIIKLVTDTDLKNPSNDIDAARTEIFYSKKFAREFTKIFKKNVEIL
jgi:exopolyphosphatase/guanosine-5'-triphosphate,3'-diphosphate pyrophosphatase